VSDIDVTDPEELRLATIRDYEQQQRLRVLYSTSCANEAVSRDAINRLNWAIRRLKEYQQRKAARAAKGSTT